MISCQAAPAARTALPGGGGGRSRGPLCDSDKSAEPSRSSPLAQPDVPRALPYSAQPPTEAVAGTALPGTARPGPAPPLPASAIASTAPPPPASTNGAAEDGEEGGMYVRSPPPVPTVLAGTAEQCKVKKPDQVEGRVTAT